MTVILNEVKNLAEAAAVGCFCKQPVFSDRVRFHEIFR